MLLSARALPLLALVAFSLLVTSACSGDEVKLDDYRRQVADLFSSYDQDISGLTSLIVTQGTSDEVFSSLATYATAGTDRTNAFLAAWDALKVPERARDVHAQGRDLIQGYGDAFAALKTGADQQDGSARDAFNATLQDDIPQRLQQFQDALNGLS